MTERDPNRFDFDPFTPGVQGSSGFNADTQETLRPIQDPTLGLGEGFFDTRTVPPWLLPSVAGVLIILFIGIVFWVYTNRTSPNFSRQTGAIPVIGAEASPSRLLPSNSVSPQTIQKAPAPENLLDDEQKPPNETTNQGTPAAPSGTPSVIVHPTEVQIKSETRVKQVVIPPGNEMLDSQSETQKSTDLEDMSTLIPSEPLPLQIPADVVSSDDAAIVVHEGPTLAPAESASEMLVTQDTPPRPPTVQPPPLFDADAAATAAISARAAAHVSRRIHVNPKTSVPAPLVSQGKGNYYVQLGSVKNADSAAQEVMHLKETFSIELGKGPYRVVPVNLGEQGVYHRIQAGPYSESDARSRCAAIKAKASASTCIVVR